LFSILPPKYQFGFIICKIEYMDYYKIIKPFLYKFSPEVAHNLAIFVLKHNLLPVASGANHDNLQTRVMGLNFLNPLGLAAGFDKNGDAIDCLIKQGFGFVEFGTVTPKPQKGNAKPRLFRLTEDQAIINRFGFNNKGADHFVRNLTRSTKKTIVGANIGKNKSSSDALEDYLFLLNKIYGLSDYITVNISSPNTTGLRDLQRKEELSVFLKSIMAKKAQLIKEKSVNVPILLKLAPDTDDLQREEIAQIIIDNNIDGLVVSNTTVGNREGLKNIYANETGGLSGKPLFDMSTKMVSQMYKLTNGKIPIIGVGGINDATSAYKKIKAGASLLQIYTSLIYNGFSIVDNINNELSIMLANDGFKNISEAVGVD
jgi:dihydroorotate dehydrogenase